MKKSVAANQYPQIIWRNGKKHLWNTIHRKAFKNRPEERVRLRIIEYLLDGGWSKHRISTEEALKSQKKKTPLRTDLICYTQQFDPFLLVECKAEQITINEKTAAQIARYNQNIGAPFLLMTNGVHDYWYKIEDEKKVMSLDTIPSPLPTFKSSPVKPLAYWKERGFAGDNTSAALRKWLEKALNGSLKESDKSTRFLSFKTSPSDLDLNNYYTIHSYTDHRLALSFTATPFGGSRLVGIFNKDGLNAGVLEVNLDLLFDERKPNASIYTSGGIKNMDVRNHIEWNREPLDFNQLADQLDSLLAKMLE
jgi:hypothetical protein